MATRRIFVGDIQGCRAQLEALLSKVSFTSSDTLIPVGDLVNKGPDSAGVLRLMMELDAQPVLGNHDLAWLKREVGKDPVQAEWLASQPFLRVMSDVIAVHAGLHPSWSEDDLGERQLTTDEQQFAVTVRYCDEQGRQPKCDWPAPSEPFRPWYEFYRGERRVVFGHWARQGLFRGDRVLGLDTGCVYGKCLTAWIAETDELVQVDGWRS